MSLKSFDSESLKLEIKNSLNGLLESEGLEFLKMILGMFRKRLPNDLKESVLAFENRDFESLAKKTHLLTGSFQILEINMASNIAREASLQLETKNSEEEINFSCLEYIRSLEVCVIEIEEFCEKNKIVKS